MSWLRRRESPRVDSVPGFQSSPPPVEWPYDVGQAELVHTHEHYHYNGTHHAHPHSHGLGREHIHNVMSGHPWPPAKGVASQEPARPLAAARIVSIEASCHPAP